PQRLRRFAAEARLLGRLSHPGIARILEAGLQEIPGPGGAVLAVPFLILELVEGERLDRYAARISPTDRLRLFALLCDAVDHAHQQGVIHRDLKPSNVLVDRTGQPKVLDFGVACACAASRSGGREPTRSTSTGQVLGSLPYMSPEQLGGDPRRVDARADVYALGVILHEMLTGRPPVDVRDLPLAEAAARVAGTEAAAELAPSLGDDLRRLLGAALARDRERRYGSAAELAREVRRHLAREPVRGFAGGSRLDPWNHARKEPSLTASRLKELLSDMALDPDLMARYFRDPEAVMESAGLDERERTALQSGNPVLLHACLFGLPAAPSGQAAWPVFPVLWPVYPAWGTAAWPGYGGGGWLQQAVPAAQPPAAPPSPAEEPAPAAPPSEVPQDREPEGSPRHPSRKKTRGAAEP
ncbi:MAG TPA: protein kinase, partial [Thermoanaerobaculia bacterium]